MTQRLSLTLGQVFAATILGLALLLGALFSLLYTGSRQSIVESSQPLLKAKSALLGEKVDVYLQQAEQPIGHIENQVRYGSCEPENALSVEGHLFTEVLNNPRLSEVTFTHAISQGWDDDGALRLAPTGRWQVSVFRETPDPSSAILSRFSYRDGRRFVTDMRMRSEGGRLAEAPLSRKPETVPDPTGHLTFSTIVRRGLYGKVIWSDLSYSEIDAGRPESQRRVLVTAMKAIEDETGRFVGVVRVGLREEEVDGLVRGVQREAGQEAPYRIFICDSEGRRITRLTADDRLAEQPDTALRFVSDRLPPEVARALRHPALQEVAADHLDAFGRFTVGGRRFLLSFKGLPYSQEWRVGVVVAEDELPGIGALLATRDRLLRYSLAVIGLILAGGVLTLRTVRSGLARIVDSTTRMRSFDFAPAEGRSVFRDVREAMESLELAKTALRAMGKYVPVDLVRLLYQTGREPMLGGELAEVSIMFTDIKDFTSLSERVTPNELAQVLGRYLEVMTETIHAHQGEIDKYIGDAIMAVWNVPTACPGHARKACAAALACVESGRALFASPEWAGRPPLVTRFGLHADQVMVGHFGAPDRMSYTALGDGVNLASRLEGLNKHYGTTILASEAIRGDAGAEFAFRLLDVVAVKGKTRGVRVYELLGPAGVAGPHVEAARRYEEAFEAYLRRDFGGALARVAVAVEDHASQVLAERCRKMIDSPPPADWDGTFVATSK